MHALLQRSYLRLRKHSVLPDWRALALTAAQFCTLQRKTVCVLPSLLLPKSMQSYQNQSSSQHIATQQGHHYCYLLR
jgi:hypothetical protein